MTEGQKLTLDVLKTSLSKVGKTFGKDHSDGSSFAFVKLDLTNKGLSALSEDLANYQQLRHIVLGSNSLKDINVLGKLRFVLTLEAPSNQITDLSLFNHGEMFRFLRHLNLAKNQVESLQPLQLPELQSLCLSHNRIASAIRFLGHPMLQLLELRGNQLLSLEGLGNMPKLTHLYLAQNEIVSLAGLHDLPALEVLHLRGNKLERIDADSMPSLPALKYINLRENPVPTAAELGKLSAFRGLTKLHVQGGPLAEEVGDNLKKEILIVLPNLLDINKEEVTPEEKEDAIAEAAERAKVAEEARLEAERQAREAAAKALEDAAKGDPAPEDPVEESS